MAAGTFRYTARTIEGQIVRGSMEAPDPGSVLDLLRSRALFVTAVDRESDAGDWLRRARASACRNLRWPITNSTVTRVDAVLRLLQV